MTSASKFNIGGQCPHCRCSNGLHDLDCRVAVSAMAEKNTAITGVKYDTSKPAMDLMPPLMEMEVAKVLTFGAQKYDAENWRHLTDLHARYRSAAKRHINALKRGEQFDDESGLHHAAHAVCCLMFLGEIDLEQAGKAPVSGSAGR